MARPPKYKTVEDLQKAIEAYFDEGVKTVEKIVTNKLTQTLKVPTITGLCHYLGFESRQSFYDLQKQPKFSYTIKKARLQIEQAYEEQLQAGNPTGAIFALKNMGWKDKQEIEQQSEVKIKVVRDNHTAEITPSRTTANPN